MSNFTDSLRNDEDDEFKTFLLDVLSNAEAKHAKAEKEDEINYWQGRKDGLRIVLACYLNSPEIADLIKTTVYAYHHNYDV